MHLNITNTKIPVKMKGLTNLTLLDPMIITRGLRLLIDKMESEDYSHITPPSSSTTWGTIAREVYSHFNYFEGNKIVFAFYWSKNIFSGSKVISHADFDPCGRPRINYNTRFHSANSYAMRDWWKNLFHEYMHHADINSPFSFGHADANDKLSAPYLVGEWAGEIYDQIMSEQLIPKA